MTEENECYRKHQLIERFLVDVIGFTPEKAHGEAERLSEVASDDLVDGLDKLMQHPALCPDGNAIPGEEEHPKDVTTLCDMKPGETGLIVQLGYGLGQRSHLQNIGLREGKRIRIKGMQPRMGPIVVDVDGIEIALGRRMSARVFVKKE